MALFISTSQSIGFAIGGDVFVLPGVVLTPPSVSAIRELDGLTASYVKVDGHLYSGGSITVSLVADGSLSDTLVIGNAGTVDAIAGLTAVLMTGAGSHFVNHGAVHGGITGLGLAGGLFARVENHGLLAASTSGNVGAGLVAAGSNSVAIQNSGRIEGGNGILMNASYCQIDNSGKIVGTVADGAALNLLAANGGVTVLNTGRIAAPVTAILGGDTGVLVTNAGTIVGDVRLGASFDSFLGREGILRGVIDGGGGEDRIETGSNDDDIYGGAGSDRLFGGGGDDQVFGGDGGDRLSGDSGDDTLRGGKGDDDFLFRRDGGDDRVADFVDGSDQLDVSRFQISSFTTLAAAARDVSGGMLLNLTGFSGGTVVVAGFTKAQFDVSDVIL